MFKVSIQAGPLDQLLNLISAINDEARFNFSENGLSISQVDNANVAMGIFNINPDGFNKYAVKEPISIGIDVNQLARIVEKLDPFDSCVISHDAGITSFEVGHRWFNITQNIDTIRKEPRILNLELPITFSINPLDLKKDLKYCFMVDDIVTMSYTPRRIELSATDEDNNCLFKSSYEIEEFLSDNKSTEYTLDYLVDLVSSLKYKKQWICDKINVSFGTEWPLSIEGQTSENLKFRFILAPRINND